MPFKLRKAPKRALYWVVGPDGKHHSKDPLPKEQAEAQMRALYSTMVPTAREEKAIEKKMEGGRHHALHGAGPLPELSILQQIAKASYSNSPPQSIGPFQLSNYTPTLKFYILKDPSDPREIDTVVVGIRGTNTSDKQDIYADAKLGLGQLEDTPRWKKDFADFTKYMSRFKNGDVDVYGVGHSLGGAVLDMFLKKGFIRQGVSYNPAISLGDADKDIPNRRIYQEGDPLLAIMGRSAKNVEVRPKKQKKENIISRAARYFIPYYGVYKTGKDALDAHALDNFNGGSRPEGEEPTEEDERRRQAQAQAQQPQNRLPRRGQFHMRNLLGPPPPTRPQGDEPRGPPPPPPHPVGRGIHWSDRIKQSGEVVEVPKDEIDPITHTPFEEGEEIFYAPKGTSGYKYLKISTIRDIPSEEDLGKWYYPSGPPKGALPPKRVIVKLVGGGKNDLRKRVLIKGLEKRLYLDPSMAHSLARLKERDAMEDKMKKRQFRKNKREQLVLDEEDPKPPMKERLSPLSKGSGGSVYLRQARAKAKAYGLDPKKLKLATDGKHKLDYDGVKFGLKHYNDFLLWSAEEKAGRVPKGTAEKKRTLYRARAEKIKGEWKANKVSPNNLAIHILW